MKIQLLDNTGQSVCETHTIFDELRCIYMLKDMTPQSRMLIDMILSSQYLELEHTTRRSGPDVLHRLTFKIPSKMTIHLSLKKIPRFVKNFNALAANIIVLKDDPSPPKYVETYD